MSSLIHAIQERKVTVIQSIMAEQISADVAKVGYQTIWERTIEGRDRLVAVQNRVHQGQLHATEEEQVFLNSALESYEKQIKHLKETKPATAL